MDQSKEPHLISIKGNPPNLPLQPHHLTISRLSRPSLADQDPLSPSLPPPLSSINTLSSLSHPASQDPLFTLSPLLSLPTGFGTAFVGSTFSCTICANNELPHPSLPSSPSITSIHISAEISTPSSSTLNTPPTQLPLFPPEVDGDSTINGLPTNNTVQKLLSFDLREEGAHVLAVNVSYEVTTKTSDGSAVTGRRTRLFRKLYQFAAVPCLSVRTKATDLVGVKGKVEAAVKGERKGERWVMEAQLENLSEGMITLEKVVFNEKKPFKARSLNWDMEGDGKGHLGAPTLSPRAVYQVCHVVYEEDEAEDGEEEEEGGEGEEATQKEVTKDGRVVLGTLSIKWRGPMGEPGILSTGWLTSKRR